MNEQTLSNLQSWLDVCHKPFNKLQHSFKLKSMLP